MVIRYPDSLFFVNRGKGCRQTGNYSRRGKVQIRFDAGWDYVSLFRNKNQPNVMISAMNDKTTHLNESTTSTASRSFRTANLQALLEVIARARREQTSQHKPTATTPGTPLPFLQPDQVQQWFTKERYVIGESVAQGGMARIFCAADLHLCRTVALKTGLENSSAEDLSRFLFEAQITAQLQHPNIIPIYDMGLEKETCLPFFTMKYVSGRTALDIILGLRRNNPKIRHQFGGITERLTIFLKACDAIAYAHSLDVIHRDIKPANIMVGNHGEVYVIDWGIAQARNPDPGPDPATGRLRFNPNRINSYRDIYGLDQTMDQGFLGSPVHMAPEQFINPEAVDERSDIYGLGCPCMN